MSSNNNKKTGVSMGGTIEYTRSEKTKIQNKRNKALISLKIIRVTVMTKITGWLVLPNTRAITSGFITGCILS